MGTMKAADLHRIVTEAGLFASDDPTIPAVNAIKFEISATAILAVATDRFSLAVSRAPYDGKAGQLAGEFGEDWSFELHPAEWKRIAAAAKTPKRDEDWREIEIKRAENGIVIFRFNDGNEHHVREAEPGFPPSWRHLFPTAKQVEDTQLHRAIGVDPKFLARFTKIAGKNKHIRIVQCYGPSGWKAFTITVAERDDFVGLVMPVKLDNFGDDDLQHLPDWL